MSRTHIYFTHIYLASPTLSPILLSHILLLLPQCINQVHSAILGGVSHILSHSSPPYSSPSSPNVSIQVHSAILGGVHLVNPYLILRVRRDNIVQVI